MMMRIEAIHIVALLAVTPVSPALAWGNEGHQIIAYIAASELSPKARAEVSQLLGGDAELSMVQVSTWADEIRSYRRETSHWHYVDIPIGSTGYDASRDCPNDDCVVAQIERDQKIMGDRQLAPAIRAEALKFLIHFVGDIHQPLHASNNQDRGGNGVRVVFQGRYTNLHAVWDTPVVIALGDDPHSVAQTLEGEIKQPELRRWQSGSPSAWAKESFRIASDEIYAKLPGSGPTYAPIVLPDDYATAHARTVKTRLEEAGTRLAWILDETFR